MSPSVSDLLASCLEAMEAEREQILGALCAEHPDEANGLRVRLGRIADPADPEGFGPYRTIEVLGRGGQGVVYLAEDTRLGRRVALKVLPSLGPASSALLQRFEREAQVAARLDHPGICRVYDVAREGTPYIAMQYIAGKTMAASIAASRAVGSRTMLSYFDLESLTEESFDEEADEPPDDHAAPALARDALLTAIETIERAARALHAAHEAGIVHRDVKPGNIMITPNGEPVWLDFGLATDAEADIALTATGDVFGTPAYMSPEQVSAAEQRVDRRTDVYSLGVALFEALTLRRPFEAPTRQALYDAILHQPAPNPREFNPSLPRQMGVVLGVALDKDPGRRYPTAEAFADDLARIRRGEPVAAQPVSRLVHVARWARRRPAAATLAIVVAVGTPSLALGMGSTFAAREIADEERAAQRRDRAEQHVSRGYALLGEVREDAFVLSEREFRDALQLAPTNAAAIGGLVRTKTYRAGKLQGAGRKDEADALYRAARVTLDDAGLNEPTLHRLGDYIDARLEGRTLPRRPTTSASATPDAAFLAGRLAIHHGHLGETSAFVDAARHLSDATLLARMPRSYIHYELTHAAAHVGDGTVVRRLADAIIEQWPEVAESWSYRGWALARIGVEGAVAAYERALRLDPTRHATRTDLIELAFDRGDFGHAEELLRQGIELQPGDAELRVQLGVVLVRRKQDGDAIAAFRAAIMHQPDHAQAHAYLADALRRTGRVAEAIRHLRERASRDPEDPAPFVQIGAFLGDSDLDGAVAAFETACSRAPKAPNLQALLATALVAAGRSDRAVAAFERALALQPANDDAFGITDEETKQRVHQAAIELAAELYEDRDFDSAETAYRANLAVAPRFATAHLNLAGILRTRDELAVALRHLRLAHRWSRGDRAVRDRNTAQFVADFETTVVRRAIDSARTGFRLAERDDARDTALEWLDELIRGWEGKIEKKDLPGVRSRILDAKRKLRSFWSGRALARIPESDRPAWVRIGERLEALSARWAGK